MLIEELIETVTIHADRFEATATGAPPLLVNLNEVGSRDPGTGSVVSEDRTKRRTIPSRNLLAFIGYWLTVGSGFSLIIATDNPNSGSTSVACQGSYQVVVANQPPTAKT